MNSPNQNTREPPTQFLYPISFADFTHQKPPQTSSQTKVKNYHNLIKMRKMLSATQQKMNNRIKLFRKASEKILKKREQEFMVFQRIENIKNHPFFLEKIGPKDHTKSIQQPRKLMHSWSKEEQYFQNSGPLAVEKCIEERTKNAKSIKEDKERYKVIIQERTKNQMQRKLQSANLIRRKRDNAKIVKEQLELNRKLQIDKTLQQKFEQEKQEFIELEKHLSTLQIEEKEALMQWKQTMCMRS